jgi:ubiquitin C-terminal hydrolase
MADIYDPMEHAHKYLNRNCGNVGLANIGNTCYMNSVIQCLSHTMPLTHYLLSGMYQQDLTRNPAYHKASTLLKEYINMLKTGLWSTEKRLVYTPHNFKMYFGLYDSKFSNFQQHDAHEALQSLLNAFHYALCFEGVSEEEEKPVTCIMDRVVADGFKRWKNDFMKQYSKVIDMFYGQFITVLQCTDCTERSFNYDPFSVWNLQLTKKTKTLQDCLRLAIEIEQLDKENGWTCDHCHVKNCALKRTKVLVPPHILTIVLNRFDHRQQKVDYPIAIPETLDLAEYSLNARDQLPKHYQLYGAVHHIGSLSGGHYWAHCKDVSGTWYSFNDHSVAQLSPDKYVNESSVYVLFYQRVYE